MNDENKDSEAWTDTENMLKELIYKRENDNKRNISGYQWAICVLFGLLTFILGIQCQNERISTTVIKTEARVTAVENDIGDLKSGIQWLQNNTATKQDIQQLSK